MPDVSGLELLQHVRRDDNLRDVPVISEFAALPGTLLSLVETCFAA